MRRALGTGALRTDIASYTGRPVRGCSNLARKISAIDCGARPESAARGFERSPFRNVLASVDRGADCGESRDSSFSAGDITTMSVPSDPTAMWFGPLLYG